MNAPRRPTLRAVAQAAGVSLAAASLALRNDPQLPAATRERIQAVARRLGYHPDPKLSALMSHLRTGGAREYRETLAYIGSHPYAQWSRASQHDYYLGARERAGELGYKVELFDASDPDTPPRTLSRLLAARGIRGLFIGPFNETGARLELNWSRFAAVTFGYSLTGPNLHRVVTDYHRSMLAVLERLAGEGCRRIGLNLRVSDDVRSNNFWRSAYLFYESQQPRERRVPINASADGRAHLSRWLGACKPDAVISIGCDFPQAYEAVCGKPPPAGIRYVNMNIHHADARSRGVDQDSFTVGRVACEQLVAMLQRDELGVPARAQTTVVESLWVENYKAWRTRQNYGSLGSPDCSGG